MSYILTYKKIEFYPLEPRVEDIDIEDVAHALSLLCRANGHFKHFYSVGQHSINCAKEAIARGYSTRVAMGCLIHDASEAYLADITRPVKKHLHKYLEIEDKLQGEIFEKWIPSLTHEETKLIFEIDVHRFTLQIRSITFRSCGERLLRPVCQRAAAWS